MAIAAITDRVLVAIDEAIDGGAELIPACAQVLDWIKRGGLGDELLAEHGIRLLSDLYRNHAPPPAAVWSQPGHPKVTPAGVSRAMAIFREYEAVVGKRLGDCTADDLRALADHRRGLAEANALAVEMYLGLARRLRARKVATVHAAFKDHPEELVRLYRGVRDAASGH